MLTILILLILAVAFYEGYRRGFSYQLFFSGGFLVSCLIARAYYASLADILTLWLPYPSPTVDSKLSFYSESVLFDLDKAFYAGCSFLLILLLCTLVVHLIAIFAKGLNFITLFGKRDSLIGGILGAVLAYIVILFILTIASYVPLTMVQTTLKDSFLAKNIIEHTPFLSNQIYQLWLTKML